MLSESEVCKVLNAPGMDTPRGLRDTAIFELLYSTGIRREECLNLMVRDIDLDNAVIRINLGKGKKDRLLPLGQRALKVLGRYIREVRPYRTLSDFDSGRLFINLNSGQPLSKVGLSRMMHIYTRKALKKPLGCHVFRRSFATHLLRNGADIIVIQNMLGHADSRTTHKYVRISARDLKQAHKKSHPRERATA